MERTWEFQGGLSEMILEKVTPQQPPNNSVGSAPSDFDRLLKKDSMPLVVGHRIAGPPSL